METLAQMLEDYRKGERGLPSYDELIALASVPLEEIEAAEKYALLYADDDRQDIVTDVLNAFYAGGKYERIRSKTIAAKEQSC